MAYHLRLALTLSALVLVACGRDKSPAIDSAEGLDRYRELPGAKGSHLSSLREELARLESEGATASQLSNEEITVPTARGSVVQAGEKVPTSAALIAVFESDLKETLFKQLNDLYPVGPFVFSSSALQTAIQLKDRYDQQRQQIHRIISERDQDFGIQLTQGLAADTSFIDVVTIANRLDAIVVAEFLYLDDPSSAMAILREMMAAIEAMASEQHIVPRIAAVHRRGEALRVMESIANHPSATLETHTQLARLVGDQLAAWPPDASAWIGDRAVGMQTYELVRDGYLLSILGDKETSRLRREVGLDRLAEQVANNLDQDELIYLRAMRRTISLCRRPYFQRQAAFRETNRQLESLRDSLLYPLVADLILWTDVQEGQRLQALDRARCEAWSIALATSIGAPRPPYGVNPLTGTPYIMDLRADRVIVDGIDPDHGRHTL